MYQLSGVALLGVAGLTMVGLSRRIRHEDLSIRGDIAAPPAIEVILKRSCYDCHSNETGWPWYGFVAPLSWWMERKVELGRKQLNFSEWGSYYPTTKIRKLQWIDRTLGQKNMPPWSYRILHPQAALNQTDLIPLLQWLESELASQRSQQYSNASKEHSK
jgi:heme-binding protein